MTFYHTSERNIQIVLSLLKANHIRRVIASPGSTNVAIVSSMQYDAFFEMYSAVDERSACYMACGMAAETGEPVVIVCTGATSSRDYMPGLTEAYYRHLPVLAITCCRSNSNVGHYVNQVTDRSTPPSDTANISVYVQAVHCEDDEWDCMIKANKAILGLKYNGGGPCHINLETVYSRDFNVKDISPVRVIERHELTDELPEIPEGKIGVFVGAFSKWQDELTEAVDNFCKIYNAVVFYDQSSNYRGSYGVLFPVIAAQNGGADSNFDIDLMIHIGYVSASICTGKEMWRVNIDGELRDTFKRTTHIFQMSELNFFRHYINGKTASGKNILYKKYAEQYTHLINSIPELPFSNIWVAKRLAPCIPVGSVMHFGICNSLRSWNNFLVPTSVQTYSNTGGFGIDGGVSSLVGASFVNTKSLYFGVFGDLLFYYDMNSLGNRDILPNLRIIIINNGLGQEFKNRSSFGAIFNEDTDRFIAAKGHFGNRCRPVIECYAESLGFEYLAASSKDEFDAVYTRFVTPKITDKPMLFEIFTESEDESDALEIMTSLTTEGKVSQKATALINRPDLAGLRKIAKKILRR